MTFLMDQNVDVMYYRWPTYGSHLTYKIKIQLLLSLNLFFLYTFINIYQIIKNIFLNILALDVIILFIHVVFKHIHVGHPYIIAQLY